MQNSLIILILCLQSFSGSAQASGGFEQLYYPSDKGAGLVPMVHYTTGSNWYTEARYNYDEAKTFALYAGRRFAGGGQLSYAATPVIGGLLGAMKGGSAGVNMDLDFQNLFFSCQSQYTFSFQEASNKYFFSWSELGYQATPWLYSGLALQQTYPRRSAGKLEPGFMVGFSMGNWTVPLYLFSPAEGETLFVTGINWAWGSGKKSDKSNGLPIRTSDQTKY